MMAWPVYWQAMLCVGMYRLVKSNGQHTSPPGINLTFSPQVVTVLTEGETATTLVNYSCFNCTSASHFSLRLENTINDVTELVNQTLPHVSNENDWSNTGHFTLQGLFLGKSKLNLIITEESSGMQFTREEVHSVHVLRQQSALDTVFIVTVSVLVAINTVAFSCSVDLSILKQHLRRPFGIIIGFCCQYGFMPVIAYGLARAFDLPDGVAFGLLCYGASPGGGGSNVWCILLNADLNLSISMTSISLASSLAMTTAWVLGLGREFTKKGGIVIPFENIVISLASFSSMCVVGLVIQRYLPRVARVLTRAIKPLALIIITYILTLGVYTNRYVFQLMNSWQVVLSAMLVSYVGYTLSGIAAFFCRRSWKVSKTIMIETGIQNGALAILMVRYSLPQPDGDLATVAPATALITSSLPLLLAFAIQCLHRKVNGIPLFDRSDESRSETSIVDDAKKNGTSNIAFDFDSISYISSSNTAALSLTSSSELTGSGMMHFRDLRRLSISSSKPHQPLDASLSQSELKAISHSLHEQNIHFESTI